MILTRFYFSKHISLYSITLYIQKRLSLYRRLMAIESEIASMYALDIEKHIVTPKC